MNLIFVETKVNAITRKCQFSWVIEADNFQAMQILNPPKKKPLSEKLKGIADALYIPCYRMYTSVEA